MNTSHQKNVSHATVGIIGGGFGALMSYTVLRFRGMPGEQIQVFAPNTSPTASWEGFTRPFRLTHMRSESLGHFYPTDSPGLATVEAVKTLSLKPIVQRWFDGYHPTVEFFLTHARGIMRAVGYSRSLVLCKIDHIEKLGDSFLLYDADGVLRGQVQHLIIAVGHGLLNIPPAMQQYREKYGADHIVEHCFEYKSYLPNQHVLVVGDGLTAGTEWVNVLKDGGKVTAVTRHGKYFLQALNTPRKYVSRRGLTPYRAQVGMARLPELALATRGTIKPYMPWMKLFKKARKAGQLEFLKGELISMEKLPSGKVLCIVRLPDGHATKTMLVDKVIIGTGFLPAITQPFLKKLIQEHKLCTVGTALKVEDDFCIRELTTPNSIAGVIGTAASFAIPASDTLFGLRVVAHKLADHIMGPETWRPRELLFKTTQWFSLVVGKELI